MLLGSSSPNRRLAPALVAALGLIASGVACSSKPAEVDTAEASPDPAVVKPAPKPEPAAQPAAEPAPATPPPAEAKP